MYVYAIEYMPSHVQTGITCDFRSVIERLEPEITVSRPRRIYTEDLPELEANEAFLTLKAVCSEHGYQISGENRYAVDMIALHTFYRKRVVCEMRGANPWASSGNKLYGLPLREFSLTF